MKELSKLTMLIANRLRWESDNFNNSFLVLEPNITVEKLTSVCGIKAIDRDLLTKHILYNFFVARSDLRNLVLLHRQYSTSTNSVAYKRSVRGYRASYDKYSASIIKIAGLDAEHVQSIEWSDTKFKLHLY